MTYSEAALDFIDAINYDRFAAIEAAHNADAVFHSFRGPILHSNVAIEEWHREFLRNYADCTYNNVELIEEDNQVVACAIIEAKGYDFRRFFQRIVDVFEFDDEEFIDARRLYAMLRDIEMDKQVAAAHSYAVETRGGSATGTRDVVSKFYDAVLQGDGDAAKELIHEKSAVIDSIYGIAPGADAIVEVLAAPPKPAFGVLRVTNTIAGENVALVELSVDPSRPRTAHFVRVVEDKVAIVEVYWMLREIGFNPFEEYSRDRHHRRAILPA